VGAVEGPTIHHHTWVSTDHRSHRQPRRPRSDHDSPFTYEYSRMTFPGIPFFYIAFFYFLPPHSAGNTPLWTSKASHGGWRTGRARRATHEAYPEVPTHPFFFLFLYFFRVGRVVGPPRVPIFTTAPGASRIVSVIIMHVGSAAHNTQCPRTSASNEGVPRFIFIFLPPS
jgi:hypothetical protein